MEEEEEPNIGECLLEGLRKMYKSQRHTDVVINVENQSFPCHRVVLSSVSSYFDAMFSSGMIESFSKSITLHDISSKTFEKVLQYIYLGEDIIEEDNVGELLHISVMLQISQLQTECENLIYWRLHFDTCLEIWKLGKLHNVESIVENSLPLILANFDKICESENFLKLDKDELELILRDRSLRTSGEDVVCNALFRWIRVDETCRKTFFPDLFKNIRLTSVSLEYLLDHLDQHPYILENDSFHKAVKNAIKFHALPSRRQELTWDEKPYRNSTGQELVLAVVGLRLTTEGVAVPEFIGYSFSEKMWVDLETINFDLGEDFAVSSHGHDIFITGGTSSMTSCFKYSAKCSKWLKQSPLCCGRYSHSMVTVRDSLYVLGGINSQTVINSIESQTSSSIERYDMATEKWKPVGELNFGVQESSAAVIDDKIFILGSYYFVAGRTGVFQCYDTTTGTCSFIDTIPRCPYFINAVKFEDTVHVVCSNGDLITFNGKDEHPTIGRIRNFSKTRFGLFMDQGSLCIVGGYNNDGCCAEGDNGLCSDVIKVQGDEPCVCKDLELPFPMTVTQCIRTVVDGKYPLLDCRDSWTREYVYV